MKSRLMMFAFAVFVFTGCDYNNEKAQIRAGSSVNLTGKVGFSEVREKVFQKYCNECHAGRGAPVFSEYPLSKAGSGSIRREVFEKRRMPTNGPLPVDAEAILKAWLDDGAPMEQGKAEPSPSPTASASPEPTLEVVRWADVRDQVFRSKCTMCHSSDNNNGRVPLDNLEEARGNISTILGLGMMDQMPPEDWPKMTKAQKLMLSRWIIDGMQE